MKFDKERIKSAVKFSVIGLAVAVVLGAVLGAAAFLIMGGPFITLFTIVVFFIYFLCCGWTLVYLILNIFFSDKYITSYSVIGIYYGGMILAAIANKLFPDMSLWFVFPVVFIIAFIVNFIVIDEITYRKEKKQREYEEECKIFLKGKEAGFKEGYKAGYKAVFDREKCDENVNSEVKDDKTETYKTSGEWVKRERTPEEVEEFKELLENCTPGEKEYAQMMWERGTPMEDIKYYIEF